MGAGEGDAGRAPEHVPAMHVLLLEQLATPACGYVRMGPEGCHTGLAQARGAAACIVVCTGPGGCYTGLMQARGARRPAAVHTCCPSQAAHTCRPLQATHTCRPLQATHSAFAACALSAPCAV